MHFGTAIPVVPVACTSGRLAVGLGRRFILADVSAPRGEIQIIKSELVGKFSIVALAINDDDERTCYVITDGKKMQKRLLLDGNVIEEYALKRRVSAVTTRDQRIILADKFGDVVELTEEEVRERSGHILHQIKDHVEKSVNDTAFMEANSDLIGIVPPEGTFDSLDLDEEDNELGDCLVGHLSTITSMQLVERSFLVVCDKDEKIRISNYPDIHRIHMILAGHREFVLESIFIPSSSKLVSISGDCTMRLWDTNLGIDLHHLPFDHLPFKLVRCGDLIYVLFVGTRECASVEIQDCTLRVLEKIMLPDIPVGAVPEAVDADHCFWVDKNGIVRSSLIKRAGASADLNVADETPHALNLWKHDRVTEAPAKRRKKGPLESDVS